MPLLLNFVLASKSRFCLVGGLPHRQRW